MRNYVANLYSFLKDLGDETISEKQSKYMRYRFPFFGLMNKTRDIYWKEYQEVAGKLDKNCMIEFATECIRYPEREMWYIASQVLKENKKRLRAQDLKFIKDMIVKSDWWDIVDLLASNCIGALCTKFPDLRNEVNSWIKSENFWLRRTAIIYQLGYGVKTHEEILYQHILQTCHEKEFFIRKAIGWALRSYSKVNPVSVRNFIEINQNKLSNLSVKEGSKYL
ncbi:MAG: DNA alkylation repair protein [Chitinophagales bacterium]|nr:DNA alkylation repair protein [Chitinophagales bacterium]